MKNECKVCKTPYRVREAGHRLRKNRSGEAAKVLANEGKEAKRGRMKRGCLGAAPDSFTLTDKQKKKLPKAMQEGLLEYRRRTAGKGTRK